MKINSGDISEYLYYLTINRNYLEGADFFWCPHTESNRGPIDYKSTS